MFCHRPIYEITVLIIIIALELIHQRLKNLDQADYFFLCNTFKMCLNDCFVSIINYKNKMVHSNGNV